MKKNKTNHKLNATNLQSKNKKPLYIFNLKETKVNTDRLLPNANQLMFLNFKKEEIEKDISKVRIMNSLLRKSERKIYKVLVLDRKLFKEDTTKKLNNFKEFQSSIVKNQAKPVLER